VEDWDDGLAAQQLLLKNWNYYKEQEVNNSSTDTCDGDIVFTLGTGNQSAICGGVLPLASINPGLKSPNNSDMKIELQEGSTVVKLSSL
jgi:hypothetical protein